MTRNERLDKAWDVVCQLQRWIEGRDNLSTVPNAAMTVCVDSLAISVGHITVWSDQSNSPEEMTFESCRDEFLQEIEQYVPFLQDERAGN